MIYCTIDSYGDTIQLYISSFTHCSFGLVITESLGLLEVCKN